MLSILAKPSLAASLSISCSVQALAYVFSTLGRDVPTEHFYDLSGAATHLALITHAVVSSSRGGVLNQRVALMGALSSLWAVRLGSYLYDRVGRIGGDARFDQLKRDPARWPVPWVFQALWCAALQAPLTIAASSGVARRLTPWDAAGALVFAGGLLVETVADAQKDAFKRRHPHAPMTEGLFTYSVYANYFGECVLWWGQFLLAAPAATRPWQLGISAIAPIFDGLLLWRVSGIPLSEASAWRKYGDSEAYRDYRARTSLFFPLPPARVAAPADLARVRELADAAKTKASK